MFSSKPNILSENNSQNLFGKDFSSLSLENSQSIKSLPETAVVKGLFSKSEELSKLSQEVCDFPQSFEKRDQIRAKVYAFGAHSNCCGPSNTNSFLSRDIKPFHGSNKNTKLKGGVKLEFKSPFNEMKENIQCLEKLVGFQNTFCKILFQFGLIRKKIKNVTRKLRNIEHN